MSKKFYLRREPNGKNYWLYRLTIPPDMIKAKGWTDGEPLEIKMTKKGLSIEPIKKG